MIDLKLSYEQIWILMGSKEYWKHGFDDSNIKVEKQAYI